MKTMVRRKKYKSAQTEIARIVKEQPADSTFDEILRELAFRRMIDRGLEDVKNGRVLRVSRP
jgi:hypothetical protein